MASISMAAKSERQRPTPKEREREASWMVDRHINVSVIFAIAVQTVLAFMWGATLTTRVSELETKMLSMQPVSERLIKLETISESMRDSLKEIKVLVSRPK